MGSQTACIFEMQDHVSIICEDFVAKKGGTLQIVIKTVAAIVIIGK